MAGHVAPEAATGGPIAFVREGDAIRFDVRAPSPRRARRSRAAAGRLVAAAARYAQGVMAKYARTVSSASDGAVT
jgi:dihydroxy-acid dehydratase